MEPEFEIIWDEERTEVYGKCSAMTEEEFIEMVKDGAEELDLEIPECLDESCVFAVSMLYTLDNIEAEKLIPMSAAGLTIEDYWVINFSNCEY
jgi:hypothetical protein